MAQIKHIAIATQDAEAAARFYIQVMGLTEVGKIDTPNAKGYYLSDGNVNLAILDYRSDAASGSERGTGYSGIHHIGFEVEDLDEIGEKLTSAGFPARDDINAAFKLGGPRHMNVEMKYTAPDGVLIDVSQTGWVGTHGLEEAQPVQH